MIDVLLSFPNELIIILISYAVHVGLQVCQPLLVQEIVTFLESPNASIHQGYGLLGAFLCVSLGIAVSPLRLKKKARLSADKYGTSW